jgi:CRP-like cAMP-binding protein
MNKCDSEVRINALQPRIFQGLGRDDIKSIVSAANMRFVPHSRLITNQGDSANQFGLLLTGRARYCYTTPDGERLILLWITPGDSMGVSALFPETSKYLVGAEAVRDSSLLIWERSTMRNLAVKYPAIVENALVIAAHYLDWCISTHVALVCKAAPQRLAHVLATLASTIGTRMGKSIELDITNEELASAANITQFTTSRLLARWHSQNLIKKSRGRILLYSPNRLWREPL